jgi:hypothetical protein
MTGNASIAGWVAVMLGAVASYHGRSTDCAIFLAAALVIVALSKKDKTP